MVLFKILSLSRLIDWLVTHDSRVVILGLLYFISDKLIGEIVEYLQGFGTTVNVFIVADKKDVRSSEIRTRRDALNTAADNGIAYCTSNACRNARRVVQCDVWVMIRVAMFRLE